MATTTTKQTKSPKAKTSTVKVIKNSPERKKGKKANAKVLENKPVKNTVKQIVETEREIKYNYPDEIDNQLDRKAWRQKIRNKLRAMERGIIGAQDGSKEKVKLEREYKAYRKEVLLVP